MGVRWERIKNPKHSDPPLSTWKQEMNLHVDRSSLTGRRESSINTLWYLGKGNTHLQCPWPSCPTYDGKTRGTCAVHSPGMQPRQNMRPNHSLLNTSPPPTNPPCYHRPTDWGAFASTSHYIQPQRKRSLQRGKKHSLKRQTKHQTQIQIQQGCRNYQIEFKTTTFTMLRALIEKVDGMPRTDR